MSLLELVQRELTHVGGATERELTHVEVILRSLKWE